MISSYDSFFAAGMAMIVISLFILAGVIVAYVFFLLHLQKLLNKCQPQNRGMNPAMVWLNFIPLFNFGFMFYTIYQVHNALKAEFASRGLQSKDPLFSYHIGLACCAADIGACVRTYIPYSDILFSIAALVLFIIYWVKTHGYSTQLD